MAQLLQTFDALETFFADLVSSTVGLPSNDVRISFPDEGQPAPEYDKNCAFLSVSPELDERDIYKNRKRTYNAADETYTYSQQSSRTLTVQVIFYGPSCYENCRVFIEKLYFVNTKILLSQNYLAFIPDRTNGPTRFPEQHNGRWYQRCDTEVRFYNTVVIDETVSTFKEIDIRTEVN